MTTQSKALSHLYDWQGVLLASHQYHTVVKWVSIIWLFGKKNNASKKIWEFVVPEIFRILGYKSSKLAQKNAILC